MGAALLVGEELQHALNRGASWTARYRQRQALERHIEWWRVKERP